MKTSLFRLGLLLLLLIGSRAVHAAELITNGGFETTGGGFTWVLQTNGTNQTDSWWNINLPSGAHGGSRYEYLGAKSDGVTAANDVDGTLYQTVSIPSGVTSATLTYWMKITTSETPDAQYDRFYVEVRNTSGTVLQTIHSYSNLNSGTYSSWTQRTASLLSYAGQTVRLAFHGVTDYATISVFRIDDVSLVTSGTTTLPNKAISPSPVNGTTVSAPSSLSWSNGGGATSYRVYFGTDSTPDGGEDEGTQTSTSFSLPTLSSGTTYYWKINPINIAGETTGDVWSFTVSQVVTVPTVETLSATSPSANSATLNGRVTNNGGATITDRRFEWAKNSGNWATGTQGVDWGVVYDASITGPDSGFSAVLSGLQTNTAYKYRVYASNSAGPSSAALVNVVTFTTSGSGTNTDYPQATWIAAGPGHYTEGFASAPGLVGAPRTQSDVTAIVIHTTEDSFYGAAIAWFQNTTHPDAVTSAHYVVQRDGSVVQMVREKDIAHHAGSINGSWIWNRHTIGIETERLANPTEQITTAQYNSIKSLVDSIRTRFNVPLVFPSATPISSPLVLVNGIVGHGKAVQNGIDPVNWNWQYFQGLFSGSGDTTTPTISAFSVTPSSVALGNSFSVSYTVSDAGGSGLNRVVLRRTSGDGSASDLGWQDIDTDTVSGNGPVSGSFTDTPPAVGTYWYGMAVFDNAPNSRDERAAGLGPVSRTVNPRITVLSPNGGETWQAGTTQPITWSSQGVAGNVRIVLSVNGNPQIPDIASSTANDGSYSWTIPSNQNPQDNYEISVQAVSGGGFDISDQFTISGPPTRVIGLTGNLSFGSVAVGSSPTQTLTISNTGTSTLTVNSISYPSGFSGSWSGTIPAGNSQNVTVTFSPTAATGYSGTVTVNSDKTSGTNTISASGTGTITPPTVTINQASGQPDPTSSSPINFTVVFNESVTGFGNSSSDVTLGGTAGATSKIVTGSGTTYNVAVSGMTQSGTVTATIPAGAAQDAASNNSLASTSSDNSVTYTAPDTQGPSLVINSPSDNATVTSASLTVSGTARDFGRGNNGVSSVTVNGVTASGTATGGNTANWSATISLSAGTNTISIVAKDDLNNANQTQITVTYIPPDTEGPLLVIDSPADNATVTSATLTVSGTASDNGRGNNGVSSVTVNGVAANGTATGSNTANWSATITLSPGANTITVFAADSRNASTQSHITVTYNYSLTVTATHGSVSKSPDQSSYSVNSQVALTATPSVGYEFAGWGGDAGGIQNPLTVTMDGNKNITANFTAIPYTISVTASNGTVAKSPDQSTYTYGDQVLLTPMPAPNYEFQEWGGDASGMENPLSITVTGDMNITANFGLIFYPLTVNAANGTVSKSPDAATYQIGSVVALTAVPASGYRFTSWGGDASGAQNPLNVTMDGSKNITANFAAIGSVALSSATYTVTEGAGTLVVQLLRSGGSSGDISVTVTTADGTALDGSDYTGGEQVVQFADGVTIGSASIPILNDETLEVTKTFSVAISTPTGGATLGAVTAATITLNDDDQPGALAFVSSNSQPSEGADTHTITVNRTGGQRGAVSVNYNLGAASSGIPASTPEDFTFTAGTLDFADNETSRTITIGIVQDAELEGSEVLNLILSDPTGGASLGANTTHTVTITDDDTLTAAPASYTGLLNGDFASHGYGKITMLMTAGRNITGRVLADGVVFPFVGKLTTFGSYTKTLRALVGTTVVRGTLTVRLQNDGTFTGTWEPQTGATYAIAGEKNAGGTITQPLAQKGRYTAHLRGEDITPGGGSVRGYVRATVGVNGATTFIGWLPDGTKLSGASRVSVTGKLPVVFGLYQGKRGYLFGPAAITGADNARIFDGNLRWDKPPQARGIYQGGVADAEIDLAGHVWMPPAIGSRLVPDFDTTGGDMLVTLTAGELAGDIAKVVNLTTANRVVATPPTAEKLRMLMPSSTGTFSGSFLHSDGKLRRIRGAFVQDPGGTSIIEGYFPGVSVPGLVTITIPSP